MNVLTFLCIYDSRNPDCASEYLDADDMPAPAAPDCGCNNCFYGRAVLAEALLAAGVANV